MDITVELMRQQAAQLIEAVLDEEVSTTYALNRWPYSNNPLDNDPSLKAAYQALWHFEADETQQQNEVFYLDAQIELLRQISRHLALGQALPEHLIHAYTEEHQPVFYEPRNLWQSYQHRLLQRAGKLRELTDRFLSLWTMTLQLLSRNNK